MPAKSFKADGTPKARWSAADRAARGHGPRRRGGQPRKRHAAVSPETSLRPGRPAASPTKAKPRRSPDQRPPAKPRRVRPERAERGRSDRPERVQRPRPEPAAAPSLPATPAESGPTLATDTGSFTDLGLPPALVAALAESGITTPFPIQAATVPAGLAGRDVLGRAQTGSGKTLAFGLPMLTTLEPETERGRAPRGLVLAPTRELAMQVHDVLAPLAQRLGLSLVLVGGGLSYTPQQRAFARGVDLVVATPGRLIDLMDQGVADLGRVVVTVLDEADHMADLGFLPAMTTILDAVPADGQRLLFSATLDEAVDQLVRRYLNDPVTASVDAATASVTTMTHLVVPVAPADKARVTAALATRPGRNLVFVRTQLGADRVAEQLRRAGVLAGALHGGLPQGARTRILAAFRTGTLPTLVATDVAARGLHIDDIGLVLQVDPPHGSKEYLHRAGRTARAGGTGQVVTLVLPHQRKEVRRLLDRAGVRGVATVAPDDARLIADAGSADGPVSEADYLRLIAPPSRKIQGAGRSRSRRAPQAENRDRRGARRHYDGAR